MPKYVCLCLIAISTLFACNNKSDSEAEGSEEIKAFTSDSAYSSVSVAKDGEDWLVTNVNTEFRFLPEAQPGSDQPILLKIQKEEVLRNGKVETSGYKVEGILWNGDSFDEKAWKLEQEGVELEVLKSMLKFKQSGHKYGNETGNDTYFLYNIASGKPVVDYTYDRLSVNIMTEPQGLRMLTYSARLTAGESYNQFKNDSTLVGIVRYSDENEVIGEVMIRIKSIDMHALIPPYTPSIELVSSKKDAQLLNYKKNLLIWPAGDEVSAEEISTFGIKIIYYVGQTYRPVEVIIPVTNDAIDPNGIIFDNSLFELSLNQS